MLEIEASKQQKTALEDQVLVLMESIEKLQKQSKEDDVAAQRERTDLEKKIAALDAEEAEGNAVVAAKPPTGTPSPRRRRPTRGTATRPFSAAAPGSRWWSPSTA